MIRRARLGLLLAVPLSAVIVLAAVTGCSATDNWQSLHDAGIAQRERDQKQALSLLVQARDLAQSTGDRPHAIRSDVAMAEIYADERQTDKEIEVYSHIVALLEKDDPPPPDQLELARYLGQRARAWGRLPKPDFVKAKSDAERALAIYAHSAGPPLRDNAGAYAALADALKGTNDLTGAIDCDTKALKIDEQVSGKDDAVVVQDLRRLGAVLTAAGKYDEADAVYKRLIALNDKLWIKGNLLTRLGLEEYLQMLQLAKRDKDARLIQARIAEMN